MVAGVAISKHTLQAAGLAVLAVAAAACGSSGSSASSTSTGTSSGSSPSTANSSPPTTAATPAPPRVQDLVVSNAIRAQLLGAGAAMHRLPVSDYTGLVHGETYYAYDPSTGIHWAGAGLLASKNSIKAQVGDQDDGAYLVFEEPAGGHWKSWPAGIPGSSQFSCAIKVPAAVLKVWGWAKGSCHPG